MKSYNSKRYCLIVLIISILMSEIFSTSHVFYIQRCIKNPQISKHNVPIINTAAFDFAIHM